MLENIRTTASYFTPILKNIVHNVNFYSGGPWTPAPVWVFPSTQREESTLVPGAVPGREGRGDPVGEGSPNSSPSIGLVHPGPRGVHGLESYSVFTDNSVLLKVKNTHTKKSHTSQDHRSYSSAYPNPGNELNIPLTNFCALLRCHPVRYDEGPGSELGKRNAQAGPEGAHRPAAKSQDHAMQGRAKMSWEGKSDAIEAVPIKSGAAWHSVTTPPSGMCAACHSFQCSTVDALSPATLEA